MGYYRKRPVVIEAFQMTEARGLDNSEWPDWLNRAWQKDAHEVGALILDKQHPTRRFLIHTLEGAHVVTWGDWIIHGVKGELYACKPDIFDQTYEAADDR